MTRDAARELWRKSGLSYSMLDRKNLQLLRTKINERMKLSHCFDGTYRCKQRAFFYPKSMGRFFAGLRCKAYYFEDREAVSFNSDGFVGFAGWADEKNVQPILEGFVEWVKHLCPSLAQEHSNASVNQKREQFI